jgi:predicted nucleic acid-binding protein
MRLFLDANILFSAAYSDGAIRRLIGDIRGAGHILVADRYVIEEAIRNLAIHRPEAVAFLHEMTAVMTIVPVCRWSEGIPDDISLPEKDLPVLASAITARCDILVTGDTRHFGAYFGRSVGGVTIRTPVDTAQALF